MKRYQHIKTDFVSVLKFFYMLLILLVLLSTATYTWFSLSRSPKINDMTLYISTLPCLEITGVENASDNDWGQILIFNEFFEENTVLRPVTYSDQDGIFYAAGVGVDGRVIAVNQPLRDERNANRSDINGYYMKFDIYARSAEAVSVELMRSESDAMQGTYVVGSPEWDSEAVSHTDEGQGLHRAVRIGFRITRYDPDGHPLDEEPVFLIYEPNADAHRNGVQEVLATPSIDGTENLIPEDRLIRQTLTSWHESEPVQKDVLVFEHGEYLDDTHLFDLDMGCSAKIEIYLWLEGQDIDCSYDTADAAKILAGIQFYSESREQSGMEDIRS